jgi:hypothetical protein
VEVGVAARAYQQLSDDQQSPPFADNVEGAGEPAELVVAAHSHEPKLALVDYLVNELYYFHYARSPVPRCLSRFAF